MLRHSLSARRRPVVVSLSIRAFAISVSILVTVDQARAQMVYVPKNVTTPDPIPELSVAGAICHNADGSTSADTVLWGDGNYVKVTPPNGAIEIKANVSAVVTGMCEWWWGPPPGGTHYSSYDQTRYISSVGMTDRHPTSNSGYMTVGNYSWSQSLDTHDSQKTTPFSNTLLVEEGLHTFDFQTHALATNCSIPTDSASVRRSVHAVACLPRWSLDWQGNLPRFPTTQGIDVAYPTALPTPMEAAIASWNNALQGTGVQLNGVPGGACATTNPSCITVDTIAQCSNDPLSCGCDVSGGSSNGAYTTSGKIWIRQSTGNELSWTDESRQWVLAHELGHLLRLLDTTATCTQGTSVMRTNRCGQVDRDSQGNLKDAIAPTPSDSSAVVNSVYGSSSLKTCGW